MNIPPLLERLLLSNEAVFKNASLGLAGENMVYVPPGKTAVLLEFSIEPFVNDVSAAITRLFNAGVDPLNQYNNQFKTLKERLTFQMQIINDNYATYFSFMEKFEIQGNHVGGAVDFTGSTNLHFKGHREELFIYTDRSMYFNFIYPYQTNGVVNYPGMAINYTVPTNFNPTIQNLPQYPITFNQATSGDFVAWVFNGSAENYFPIQEQFKPAITSPGNPSEYLHYYFGTPFSQYAQNSIVQPQASDDGLSYDDFFKIPLVNVKYALLNKRASDYGITRPGA